MTPAGPGSPEIPPQPLLGFPPEPASWDDLVCGAPNETAVNLAGRPDAWATHALCVTGPEKSGLTYLASAWAARFGGRCLSAREFIALKHGAFDEMAGGALALDDTDLIAAKKDEQLLSLFNMVGAQGGRLLMVAHTGPAKWYSTSADLRSRLNALPVVEIMSPDEDHLRARLQAAAEQRFMKLSPETLTYLVPRLELSYEAIEAFMERLSGAVSDAGKAPGLQLARIALEGLAEDGEED